MGFFLITAGGAGGWGRGVVNDVSACIAIRSGTTRYRPGPPFRGAAAWSPAARGGVTTDGIDFTSAEVASDATASTASCRASVGVGHFRAGAGSMSVGDGGSGDEGVTATATDGSVCSAGDVVAACALTASVSTPVSAFSASATVGSVALGSGTVGWASVGAAAVDAATGCGVASTTSGGDSPRGWSPCVTSVAAGAGAWLSDPAGVQRSFCVVVGWGAGIGAVNDSPAAVACADPPAASDRTSCTASSGWPSRIACRSTKPSKLSSARSADAGSIALGQSPQRHVPDGHRIALLKRCAAPRRSARIPPAACAGRDGRRARG